MKKRNIILCLLLCAALLLSACKKLDITIGGVGKNNTTAKKIVTEIQKDLSAEDKENHFVLYGIDMAMDVEEIGKARLYYTDKLPQDLKYGDIRVVTVDTRTGEIDSISDADFYSMGASPYEYIVNGAPLMIEEWSKDSGDALKIAENTFYAQDDFVYNYVEISAMIKNGLRQYRVSFISFVNHLRYTCVVDGMTGGVISTDVTEL